MIFASTSVFTPRSHQISRNTWQVLAVLAWLLPIGFTCLDDRRTYAEETPASPPLKLFSDRAIRLGVDVVLQTYAPDETRAKAAFTKVWPRIDELNSILSDYDPQSEVMRLCASAPHAEFVPLSKDLSTCLQASVRLARESDGAFDVTIGQLVKQWRRARRKQSLPTPTQIAAARESMGWQNICLSPDGNMVRLLKPGMQIDFGGIAKGYVAEEALKILQHEGLPISAVAVSGDMALGDAPPSPDAASSSPQKSSGWKVLMPIPKFRSPSTEVVESSTPLKNSGTANTAEPDSPVVYLSNCCISTAGDEFQFLEIDGVRYSHILDPATGMGLTRQIQATVIAPHGIDADGLDTTLCILGHEKGARLMQHHPAAAWIVHELTPEGKVISTPNEKFKQLTGIGNASHCD
ncbi:Thiamine biosynthesis lipoprotein ApbE precursor [Planctopirus ephydatiae]|uniref:FAD:protein FMN transferase n=1 Tax=Planctopirus ephydatiae TaxID=2528019 RepID=A0A518GMF0_9PLAN|nr:FAD:protein FMN transferase [Planctopirus ephydatiae]QDV29611.1 Thiamine biosynthesis lipoprotein ApbE precursor [Planctopirus ephydatiae]